VTAAAIANRAELKAQACAKNEINIGSRIALSSNLQVLSNERFYREPEAKS
jgi:hypothetical protein